MESHEGEISLRISFDGKVALLNYLSGVKPIPLSVVCIDTRGKRGSSDVCRFFTDIQTSLTMLRRLWLIFAAMTLFSSSDLDFIATDNFPVILGISNTLIHARVGLGWSHGSGVEHKPHLPAKHASDAVWYVYFSVHSIHEP